MKKNILFLIIFILFLNNHSLAQPNSWNNAKSTHFMVYFKKAPSDFINKLIERAEEYYNRIADDLGFRRFDFWLWNKRATIYIHDGASEYQTATGQPSWSSGSAVPKDKVIHSFVDAQGFLETVLPHEMGHIIFREFVGFNNSAVTLWLDEGVASYQQKSKYFESHVLIRGAISAGYFMPLDKLANFTSALMLDKDTAKIFYAEAYTVIDYLIKEFGRDKFVLFCQNLRDKQNLARAISSSYPYSNIQELDQAWQKYLKK